MREIKFRGRVPDKGWLYGDLRHFGNNLIYIVDKFGHGSSVNPDTVGQFTGLRDSEGKEIYEGDIVKYFDTDEFWIVGYEVDFGRLIIYSAKDRYSNYGAFGLKDSKMVTVIGNNHDNPELLTGSGDNAESKD